MTAHGFAIACALFILILHGTGAHAATPVYFKDQVFTTLDQLDQALEDGEITYDEYELLVEQFVGEPDEIADDSLLSASADTAKSTATDKRASSWKYRGSLRQKFDQDQALVRYDRVVGKWNNFELKMALEQGDRDEVLVRSRSLDFHRRGSEIILGSYDLRVGREVTLGSGSFHSQLRDKDSFGASLTQPIKNRHNGLLVRQDFGVARSGLYYSHIKGSTHYRTAAGGFVEFGRPKRSVGIVFLRQQVGINDSASAHAEFLSPYFQLTGELLTLSGESSLGLGSPSAHVYQAQISQSRIKQEITFFSYASGYRNLQTGGHAYSDYDDLAIEEIGFEYRDKRAGRIGIATATSADVTNDVGLGLSLNRWNNRLDGRRCAVAEATVSARRVTLICEKLTIRALWENLDLTTDNSNRRVISMTASSPAKRSVELETLFRIERRVRSGNATSPLTVRSDLLWRVSSDLAVTATARYYNPNCGGAATDYLHFSLGQKLLHDKTFSVWLQVQNRYLIDRQRLDNWEARVYCDLTG